MIASTDEWWHGTNFTELSKPILPFLARGLWKKKCSQLCQPESASPRQQWSQGSSWHIQMGRSVRDIKFMWSRKAFPENERGIANDRFFLKTCSNGVKWKHSSLPRFVHVSDALRVNNVGIRTTIRVTVSWCSTTVVLAVHLLVDWGTAHWQLLNFWGSQKENKASASLPVAPQGSHTGCAQCVWIKPFQNSLGALYRGLLSVERLWTLFRHIWQSPSALPPPSPSVCVWGGGGGNFSKNDCACDCACHYKPRRERLCMELNNFKR